MGKISIKLPKNVIDILDKLNEGKSEFLFSEEVYKKLKLLAKYGLVQIFVYNNTIYVTKNYKYFEVYKPSLKRKWVKVRLYRLVPPASILA